MHYKSAEVAKPLKNLGMGRRELRQPDTFLELLQVDPAMRGPVTALLEDGWDKLERIRYLEAEIRKLKQVSPGVVTICAKRFTLI